MKEKDELERLIIDTVNNLHMCDEKELRKRFINLKNILSERALETFAEAITKRMDTGVTAQEAMDKINFACNIANELANGKWIDLCIDNLPEFLNNKVDVQKRIDGNWVTGVDGLKSSIAYDIAEPTISSKYRYRIQEKKPIQITREDQNGLIDIMNVLWGLSVGNSSAEEKIAESYYTLKNIIERQGKI